MNDPYAEYAAAEWGRFWKRFYALGAFLLPLLGGGFGSLRVYYSAPPKSYDENVLAPVYVGVAIGTLLGFLCAVSLCGSVRSRWIVGLLYLPLVSYITFVFTVTIGGFLFLQFLGFK